MLTRKIMHKMLSGIKSGDLSCKDEICYFQKPSMENEFPN